MGKEEEKAVVKDSGRRNLLPSAPILVEEMIGEVTRRYTVYPETTRIPVDEWDSVVEPKAKVHVVEAYEPGNNIAHPFVGIGATTHSFIVNSLNASGVDPQIQFDDRLKAQLDVDEHGTVDGIFSWSNYDYALEAFARKTLAIVPAERRGKQIRFETATVEKVLGSDAIMEVFLVNPPDGRTQTYDLVEYVPTEDGVPRWLARRRLENFPDELRGEII
jgi:hypothetical protein